MQVIGFYLWWPVEVYLVLLKLFPPTIYFIGFIVRRETLERTEHFGRKTILVYPELDPLLNNIRQVGTMLHILFQERGVKLLRIQYLYMRSAVEILSHLFSKLTPRLVVVRHNPDLLEPTKIFLDEVRLPLEQRLQGLSTASYTCGRQANFSN